MKKNKDNDNFPLWVILLLLLLFVVIFYFIFKNVKVKQYRDNLADRIREKENTINFLSEELNRLKQMQETLTNKAIVLWRAVKISALIILLSIGAICVIAFKMEFWSSVFWIVAIASFAYYTITIVLQNKLGDFNETLKTAQAYFIQKQFRRVGFNPYEIVSIEQKLVAEQQELLEIKQQYFLMINNE